MIDRARKALQAMSDNAVLAGAYAERFPRWYEDQMVTDAIAKRIEEVAEAAKYRFPRQLRGDYPEIDWGAIAGMRDRLTHDYDKVDVEVVRRVVERDLPQLVDAVGRILR